MPNAAITIDRLKPLQIALEFTAEVALDRDLVVRDRVNDLVDLLRTQLVGAQVGIDVRLFQNLACGAEADSVNIGQRRFDAFVCWNFNSE